MDVERKFLIVRLVRHWHRLPSELVAVPRVQAQAGGSPGQPDLVGGNPAHGRGIRTQRSLPNHSTILPNPNHSTIL